jgi:putative membrane protein
MHYGFGVFGLHGVGTALFWLVLIAVVAWLVVALINSNSSRENPHHQSAMEILKERYATGEISRHEFETKKRDILGGHRTG